MPTSLRFCRGLNYNYNQIGRASEFLKILYEFWGYCVNGTSALQTPGGFANTMSLSYTISNTTGAGVSPIVVTTTTTHALFTGQQVDISGVLGNLAANGRFQITVINTTSFSLNTSTGNGSYTGGGLVNTTPFAWHLNFTEGSPVLAVGNDGYTAPIVSTSTSGDAVFTATNVNPFTATATSFTINTATNYRTTIAAGSNGQTLPQSTINVASTTTASTTIAAASNNVSLPTATINVASTTGFPSGGFLNVQTTEGTQLVLYTGITATTFTGCTLGRGSMQTGGAISIGFPGTGTLSVTTNAGIQSVAYTGITGTTFTGCTGGTGTMSTGGAVTAPITINMTAPNSYVDQGSAVVSGVTGNTTANGTWIHTTPVSDISNATFFNTTTAFQSNGASLPQATVNSSTVAPFATTTGVQTLPQATINVSATATASTTVAAASNNVNLPTGTINVASTTGFPTAGTLNIATIVVSSIALGSSGQSLPQSTINVASTSGFPTSGTLSVADNSVQTTIAAGSNGQALPQGTINVVSTAGFAASGTIFVTTSTGSQIVAYTGTTGTSFTGCTGGGGTMSTGGAVFAATSVTYTGTTPTSFTGVTGGTGTLLINNPIGGGPFNQTVTYTGTTATTFTGALGGFGTMFTGNTVNNTGFFTNFPTAGSLYVTTTNGSQLITYTGVTATSLTGCSGGVGNTSAGGGVFTAFSPASNYTTIAAGSSGQVLPQGTINVASTTGFPTSGFIYVLTTLGFQPVVYTGVTATSFTGCSGGAGTMTTGNPVFISYAQGGTFTIMTSTGNQVVNYTGTTHTTFTGCTGGTGAMTTGNTILSPTFIITTNFHTLLTGQTIITSGIVGMPNANSTFTTTAVSNRIATLNGIISSGSYVSGGSVANRNSIILNNSTPNGSWTSGGTQTVSTSNMINKLLVMWKPNSGTTEDGIYVITAVNSPNSIRVNLNTGGTPDVTTLHPSFTDRSNINYRIVDAGLAQTFSSGNGNYMVMQFNPSSIGLNPGQANSQVQMFGNDSAGTIGCIMSPGGNWNGVLFPVTGDPQIDATSQFTSQSGGIFNGGPANNMAMVMAADPGFFWMHFKDVNSGDGSSYFHCEIPTRLYPAQFDTNPMVVLSRGGVFNSTVYRCDGTLAGGSGTIGNGFVMKDTTGVIRTYRMLSKSLAGDGSPSFGANLTDIKLAFNTTRGTVIASDGVLCLPGLNGQFSLGRVRLRTLKFTTTQLPIYHRFGTPTGQFLNLINGIAIIWDNTILPSNLFFII